LGLRGHIKHALTRGQTWGLLELAAAAGGERKWEEWWFRR